MTITLKDKNSVWVAVGAAAVMIESHVDDTIHEDNINIWRVPNVHSCIMSSLSSGGYDLNRIRYQKNLGLSEPLTQRNLLLKVIPKLKQIFEETNMMDGNESWHTFVIAKGDKAFTVHPTFTCCEIEDFDVHGTGEDVAFGAMAYHKDLPPIERIVQSFRDLEKMRRTKHFPVVLMNTMSRERIVVYE